jgi:hypothetical protein
LGLLYLLFSRISQVMSVKICRHIQKEEEKRLVLSLS